MSAAKNAVKTFDAVLEHSGNSLNWIIIRVPFNVFKVWGKRSQIKVNGEINGFAFRSAIFPTRAGVHFLIVNKRMQAGGKAQPGTKARFRLEPDTTPRKITPPAEFVRVLGESKRLQKYFLSLNNSMRNWIAKWIADGKQSTTRVRRAEQMAELLFATMEAERELPPLLQIALAHNPRAQAGWRLMSPTHRRSHLLSIFHYRNPESRARRVAKAMEEMVQYAEKHAAKSDH
jgi:uncharacterized protein YdeI (YjbR/CyaY-like superfamily)